MFVIFSFPLLLPTAFTFFFHPPAFHFPSKILLSCTRCIFTLQHWQWRASISSAAPINFTFRPAAAAAGGINHNFHDKSAAWLGSTNLGNKSERSYLNKCTGGNNWQENGIWGEVISRKWISKFDSFPKREIIPKGINLRVPPKVNPWAAAGGGADGSCLGLKLMPCV